MSGLFTQVPVNYLLTSGAGSALTWTNAVSVSSLSASTLNASNLTVSTLATSSSVTASTLTTGRLNYSSIVGSSISTNSMTLSLTNASTQNTQIYQVATTDPTTSYTVIQASHVSTGTTNNALALNPSGGNVGVGTTAPAQLLDITNAASLTPAIRIQNQYSAGYVSMGANVGVNSFIGLQATNTTTSSLTTPALVVSNNGYVGINTTTPLCQLYQNGGAGTTGWAGQTYIGNTTRGVILGTLNNVAQIGGHTAALGAWADLCINGGGGNVGIGTTNPQATLDVNGYINVNNNVSMVITKSLYLYYISATNHAGLTTDGAGNVYIFTGVSGVANRLSVQNNGNIILSNLNTNGTVITTGGVGVLAVSSDRRIKENIEYLSDTQQGLASILNLKPATYRLIGQQDVYLGFIAQDLEQDIPLAVDGKKYEWQWEVEDGKPKFDANGDIVYKLDADGNKIVRPRGVSDRAIIATQTLAIQELSKKLDATQQQLAAKSASLDALIAWAQTQGYSVGA